MTQNCVRCLQGRGSKPKPTTKAFHPFIYILFNMNLDLSYGQNLGQVGPINMR